MPPVPVGDGWYYDGAVFDHTLSKARLLVQPLMSQYPPLLRVTTASVERYERYGDPRAGATVAAFGVAVQSGLLRRPGSNQHVGQLGGVDSVGLIDLPAAVSLSRGSRENPNQAGPRDRAELVLREMVTGTEVGHIVLFDEPPDSAFQFGGGGVIPGRLAAAPGVVAALVRDRVFVVPTKDLDAGKFPPPLHFEVRQSALAIDASAPAKLAHVARGGKGPLEFTLGGEMPGLTLDAQSGELTFDPAPFVEKAAAPLVQQSGQFRQPDASGKQPTFAEGVETYRKMMGERVERLTGRKPAGIPVLVPVSVIARDQEQQTASLDYCVVLEVPAERVLRRVAEMDAAQAASNNAAMAGNAARRNRGLPRPAAGAEPAGVSDAEAKALRDRVADLERRNHQLEAQVQLLKDLLADRNGKAEAQKPPPAGQ
jgi:hypothetical protein